ncbi:hypothetical protein [Microbulbifer sp. THAF38]|uniref:hypothetical protein n=1 Tax=Microbulbifer sp. THAF38 TaxID=2587856 RepID=UPI0012680BB6|nr:hypothetical protein [Microbulbifer sp. THAF38]QFT57147.1 hypothetical protein FIU95_21580 [Microbulbifer sp. THAF38]
MLIKADDDQFFVLPDDIAESIISDPTIDPAMEGVPDATSQDVNILVHFCLGLMMDAKLTLEENFQKIREDFAGRRQASEENRLKARRLIEKYSNEITKGQIGVCNVEDVIQTKEEQEAILRNRYPDWGKLPINNEK